MRDVSFMQGNQVTGIPLGSLVSGRESFMRFWHQRLSFLKRTHKRPESPFGKHVNDPQPLFNVEIPRGVLWIDRLSPKFGPRICDPGQEIFRPETEQLHSLAYRHRLPHETSAQDVVPKVLFLRTQKSIFPRLEE